MRIYIHDEFPPETSAMLQALYSRSDKSVEQHVQKVQERGADKFMASYYVGYGLASIGDCGLTALFVEDIAILACKAIQDNALYSGQETSTRYIDFAGRRNRCTEWRSPGPSRARCPEWPCKRVLRCLQQKVPSSRNRRSKQGRSRRSSWP